MIQKKILEQSQGAKLVLVSREPLIYLKFNKTNNQNVSEIILLNKFNFSQSQSKVDTLIEVRNQTSKQHFLKSLVSYFVCVPTENIIRTLDSTWIRSVQQVHVHVTCFWINTFELYSLEFSISKLVREGREGKGFRSCSDNFEAA